MISAALFAWTLASVLSDIEGFAALVSAASWRVYAAQTGMSWAVAEGSLPGATWSRFSSPHAPGNEPAVYDGAPPFDAAQRLQRGALRFARAEGRPVEVIVAEALVIEFADRYAEALLADAPPANDAAPVAEGAGVGGAEPAGDEAPKRTHAPQAPREDPNSLTRFLRLHPRLLDVLASMAREQLAQGAVRVSVNALFEALRANVDLYREACGGAMPPPTRNGSTWRLNNSHRAAVARLLAQHAADLAGRIDMRKSRADYDPAVIGRAVPRRARRAS